MNRSTSPRRRRRAALIALFALLLLFVWWLWPDGRLARARALRQELFAEAARSLPPEQRRAKFEELRQATAQLSPAQRRELAQDGLRRRQEELQRYAKLPPAQKRQYLDQQINHQEQMRRQLQQAGGPGGRPPGGAAFGAGRGGPNGRPRTPEERERLRQQRLDATTPEFRSLMDQFRKDLEARRRQRGLPAGAGGFGGPRR